MDSNQILKQERELGSLSARVDIVEKQISNNKIEVDKRLTNIEDTMNKEFVKMNDLIKKGDDEIKTSINTMLNKLNDIESSKQQTTGFIRGAKWIVGILFSLVVAVLGFYLKMK